MRGLYPESLPSDPEPWLLDRLAAGSDSVNLHIFGDGIVRIGVRESRRLRRFRISWTPRGYEFGVPARSSLKLRQECLQRMVPWVVEHREKIRFMEARDPGPWLDGGPLPEEVEQARPEDQAAWLFREAERRLIPLTHRTAEEMEVSPSRVSVKEMTTRWGSCGPTGSIQLCWRLIMAPVEVQRYLVVHELAHLVHRNHGPGFWGLVARHDAGWKENDAWLTRQGNRLMIAFPRQSVPEMRRRAQVWGRS